MYGNDDFGSIPLRMSQIWQDILTICITIRSSMAWLVVHTIGHIPVFTDLHRGGYMSGIGVADYDGKRPDLLMLEGMNVGE